MLSTTAKRTTLGNEIKVKANKTLIYKHGLLARIIDSPIDDCWLDILEFTITPPKFLF